MKTKYLYKNIWSSLYVLIFLGGIGLLFLNVPYKITVICDVNHYPDKTCNIVKHRIFGNKTFIVSVDQFERLKIEERGKGPGKLVLVTSGGEIDFQTSYRTSELRKNQIQFYRYLNSTNDEYEFSLESWEIPLAVLPPAGFFLIGTGIFAIIIDISNWYPDNLPFSKYLSNIRFCRARNLKNVVRREYEGFRRKILYENNYCIIARADKTKNRK